MRRKRSLTILASTTTMVLAAAPASAQLGGVVDSVTGAVDDLANELGLQQDGDGCFIELTKEQREELLAIDGDLCTRLRETSQPVDDATAKVTDTVKKTTDEVTAPVEEASPAPEPEPPSDGGSSSGGDGSGDGGSRAAPSGGSSGGGQDATSDEGADEPERVEQLSSEEDRERRMATLRALRSDISSGVLRADTGVLGPVGPGVAGMEGTVDGLAAPEVADGELTTGVAEGGEPEVADPDSDAILATSGPLGPGPQVPLALQVLAGALVLGSGAIWTIARREFGDGPLFGGA